MNILVLGHGEHGKGTFCRLLKKYHHLDSMSSSEVAAPYIYPSLKAALKVDKPLSWYYEHRGENRELWKELITLFNTPDKTSLTRLILSNVSVYDGMRDHKEFEPSRHLFDRIYWIDASERKPLDESMSIEYDDEMILIDNNGSEEELLLQVSQLKF